MSCVREIPNLNFDVSFENMSINNTHVSFRINDHKSLEMKTNLCMIKK